MSKKATTPAMRQYQDVKSQYPEHLLLFRMGDFYELFYEDAIVAAEILNITLTARDKERKIPMAGIPYHALDNYLPKLIAENKKAIIVEQQEDPKQAKGVVKRGIYKIITPGTNTYLENEEESTYLLSIHLEGATLYYSYVDINEGNIEKDKTKDIDVIINFIKVKNVKEILLTKDTARQITDLKEFKSLITHIEEESFYNEKASFSTDYALISYIKSNQKIENADHLVTKKSTKNSKEVTTFTLDHTTIKNLEILNGNLNKKTSLNSSINKCKTTFGKRLFSNWIVNPLTNIAAINKRLNSIDFFYQQKTKHLEEINTHLQNIHDLYKLSTKISLNLANPKDLRNLVLSIREVFKLQKYISSLQPNNKHNEIADLIHKIEYYILESQQTLEEINTTIVDEPSLNLKEGNNIKPKVNQELDNLKNIQLNGKEWLKDYEKKQVKETKIKNLKIKYNKVFGYYIEVSKIHADKVPENFIRKQTLVNAERFITEELKEYELSILNSETRITDLETEIFNKLLEKTKQIIPNLQQIASEVGHIDIFNNTALQAIEKRWVRPEITTDKALEIHQGRHPVVEDLLYKDGKEFIPNDLIIGEDKTLHLITGPNMGGKSTFIRQVAVITIMGLVGLYVPATKAKICLIDNIFTRVGASDNIAQGESTFMVEMKETATILEKATSKSLIILDEIGRGTSTFDGISIAWAIVEYLAKLKSKTLFATHYHELTEASTKYDNVDNYTLQIKEIEKQVIFLHKIIKGKADKSYGVHVAELAGLPTQVISTAKKTLKLLENQKDLLAPRPASLF